MKNFFSNSLLLCFFVGLLVFWGSSISNAESCRSNCDCATETPIGSTCSDGCGGYCNGIKDSVTAPNGVIAPFPETRFKSLWQFRMTYPQTDANTNILGYKNVNSPYRYSVSPEMGIYSYKIINCGDSGHATSNKIEKCDYAPEDMEAIKVFLAPGSQNEITFSKTQNSDSKAIVLMRFNEAPKDSYSSSELINNQQLYAKAGDIADMTGKDFVTLRNTSETESIFTGALPYNSPGGWLYIRILPIASKIKQINYQAHADYNNYKNWYDGITNDNKWGADGDPIDSTSNYINPDLPTGPDCNTKVCSGNSCWNGTMFIPGIKIEDCAQGKAFADPAIVASPGSTYLTWTSVDTSKLEAACLSGPRIINRGSWFLNHAECQASGLVEGCTDKGYELKFVEKMKGEEICTFYPVNALDGLPGTPFMVAIQVQDTPAKTDYVCKPDNPSCASSTCKDLSCFDGCNYLQGLKDCVGRR